MSTLSTFLDFWYVCIFLFVLSKIDGRTQWFALKKQLSVQRTFTSHSMWYTLSLFITPPTKNASLFFLYLSEDEKITEKKKNNNNIMADGWKGMERRRERNWKVSIVSILTSTPDCTGQCSIQITCRAHTHTIHIHAKTEISVASSCRETSAGNCECAFQGFRSRDICGRKRRQMPSVPNNRTDDKMKTESYFSSFLE